MSENYDVIILGAGPAGLSAGIYCGRYGMKTAIVGREIGGMANYAHKIENYPGFSGTGIKLMKKFYKQAQSFGAKFINDDLIGISKEKENLIITTNSVKLMAKSVIIALGAEKRKLNVAGEDKFLGRGVSYCATCDAFFFKKKDVAVIGGGDSASKAALLLSEIAKKVYLIHRSKKVKCEQCYSDKIKKKENIEVLNNTIPLMIKGRENVEEIIVNIGDEIKEKSIKVQGVFIEIGSLPVSDISRMLGINIDENNFILADSEMKTNVPGVFAAGDVVKSKLKQVVVAASQGAIAAKSVHEYLENL